jgi:hypothetical protein
VSWAVLVVLLVVGVVVVPAAMRFRDLARVPILAWPTLVLAAAMPCAMFWQLMNPPEPIAEMALAGLHQKVTLEVPPRHSVLVTGTLDPLAEGVEANKTDYSIRFSGTGWFQQETGNIKRKSEGGVDIGDPTGDPALRSGARARASKWGEDLQTRFDLQGSGQTVAELTLWNGKAAKAIELALIPSPVDTPILLGGFALLTALALYAEIRHKVEKLSGDVAFLALYAVFLRHSTTPADAFQGTLSALLPAFLLGEGAVAGIAWLVTRPPKPDKAKAPEQAR